MKLLRYGPKGAEKPGLLDANGQVRDLSAHVADIGGADLSPDTLQRLSALDPASLPLVPGLPQKDLRLGPCVGGTRKFICIGRRNRRRDPRGTRRLQQMDHRDVRPRR